MQTATRFAFFVDGSNLLGSLKKVGVQVEKYEPFYQLMFQESVALWKCTFLDPSDAKARISRIYWYEVGSIDDWDLGSNSAETSLKEAFGRDAELKRSFMALAGQQNRGVGQNELYEKAWRICYAEIKEWYTQKRQALAGIRKFHHAVQSETDFIDIIECGHWKVDMLHRKVEEKGLDTSLAVDMVTQIHHYDVAILVSGDADAIPSLNFVKREGKCVGVIEFIKGYPPENRGRQFSSRLKVAADFVPQIYEMDLVRAKLTKQES
jgi:uncharacterized LabA/DUF88 family protein